MKTDEKPAPLKIAPEPRLAAIDIGTNSIRCIVAEVEKRDIFRVLDDEKATVRLGEGLAETGMISSAASQRAIEALQRMTQISSSLGAEMVEVVATSAVRKARNREAFLHQVHEQTGLKIRVISGEEEAALAMRSVHHNFALENNRYALADIGGGSVEIVVATGQHTETVLSLELGVVYLSERFVHSDPINESDFKKLRKHIRKTLKNNGIGDGLPVSCLIGSGGTMTNLGGMVMAMRGEQYESVHRYEVLHSEVIHLLAMLQRKAHKERLAVAGLNPERADIIVAGMILVDELMKRCRSNQLKINHKGIREGLILQSLENSGFLESDLKTRDWRSSVAEFGRSCHFDEQHSQQVQKLAAVIYRTLAADHDFPERADDLLEAAALLHDIGYFINYDRHHKHSYHLIRHANLFGFTPRERELIANIARYHRKAKPKNSHENFAHMAPDDQLLVRQLGGILRLADGLDRRRNCTVKEIECRLDRGNLHIELSGEDDLAVEIYGGQTKGDLFENAFGYRLELSHKPEPEAERPFQ